MEALAGGLAGSIVVGDVAVGGGGGAEDGSGEGAWFDEADRDAEMPDLVAQRFGVAGQGGLGGG